jgi:hypothetical protein
VRVLRALREGPLGAILVALRGDQGKVTTSSCDTEDVAVARGLPAVLITLSGCLEVGFSRAEGGKCLEETKGYPLLL